MWRSLSTCSLASSWAGGSHHRWKRRSSWMRWNRHCGHGDLRAPSITATKALSMSRWPTRSGCRMQSCWLPRGVPVTRMITRWRRVSTVCTKRRSSTVRPGRSAQKWNWLRWHGGLVQQSSVAGTTWSHPSDRGRKSVLRFHREQGSGSLNFRT